MKVKTIKKLIIIKKKKKLLTIMNLSHELRGLFGRLQIDGRSVAARATAFELGKHLCLDCGEPLSSTKHSWIFLTHLHSDHVKGLFTKLEDHIGNDSKRGEKVTIVVPAPRGKINPKKLLKDFLTSAFRMTRHSDTFKIDRYVDIVEVRGHSMELSRKAKKKIAAGQMKVKTHPSSLTFTIKKTTWRVEVIDCYHPVPTVSYLFSMEKSVLLDEYKGKTKEDYARLKKEGVTISETRVVPVFAYICDSSALVFEENNDKIFKYPCIMTECTFLDDADEEKAVKKRHIHWKHIEPYVAAHPECTFYFFHFSARYKRSEDPEEDYPSLFFEKVKQERADRGEEPYENIRWY